MKQVRTTDVCVIGSGVAGSTVSNALLEAGREVTMLEAGSAVPMRDPRKVYDWLLALRDPFSHTKITADEYEEVGPDRFGFEGKALRATGGTTLHWSGWAYRLKPEDFKLRSNSNLGADWPLAYEDLEKYYAAAEATLQVAGDAKDQGHPPRSGPFPLPPFDYQESDDHFRKAMSNLGHHVQHHCIARNTRSIAGSAQCQTIGQCYYCPIGGKMTGDQLVMRLAAKSGFVLLEQARALRLRFSGRNKATAVDVLDLGTGDEITIEAQVFVVCSGAIETPKLLLMSKNRWWDKGVGNKFDNVGRHLHTHVISFGDALLAENPGLYLNETVAFETVCSRQFDAPQRQSTGKFLFTHGVRSGLDRSFWGEGPLAAEMMRGSSVEEIPGVLRGEYLSRFNVQFEMIPDQGSSLSLSSDRDAHGHPKVAFNYRRGPRSAEILEQGKGELDKIAKEMGSAGVKWLFDIDAPHPAGTCRMGTSADTSVVDPDLKIHDIENVYVCGSAVFPSSGAANPTLTIAALAHRLGKHLGTS